MKEALAGLIRRKAGDSRLSWSDQVRLAEETGVTLRDVEDKALAQGILPVRYQRNINAISIEDQHKLLKSRVAIVGCGGLGGYVIEELTRLGVGHITAWDYDCFEEHNINRQINARINNIGESKVEVAALRVKAINPVVDFVGLHCRFDEQNSAEFLTDMQVVIDALDNIPTRLALANTCCKLNIPLVHGAVGGWYGQVTTQFPGDDTLEQLYGQAESTQGIEAAQGILSFVPAIVASLQAAEVSKIILGREEILREKVMFINLLDMEIEIMDLKSSK